MQHKYKPTITQLLPLARRVCVVSANPADPRDYASIQAGVNDTTCFLLDIRAGTCAENVITNRAGDILGAGGNRD